MYDNTCKYLAETFARDYAAWLIGEPLELTKLEPTELSVDPIRADAVIFLAAETIVLHLEFQTQPQKNIPFRMADYRLRLYRKYPDREIKQVVIYLQQSKSPLVYQDTFAIPGLSHEFEIIRLWEQPSEQFENRLGLLPLVILSQTNNPAQMLEKVVKKLETIEDRVLQGNLAAATYIIAGLKLEKETIQKLLQSDIMKESVTYQEILQQGFQRGKQEGRQQGRQEGEVEGQRQIVVNMLGSGCSVDMVSQLTGLSVEQIKRLSSF